MCFSLPTQDDPFNDRNDPKAEKKKKKNDAASAFALLSFDDGKDQPTNKWGADRKVANPNKNEKAEARLSFKSSANEGGQQLKGGKCGWDGKSDDNLSKFLVLCLNVVRDVWADEEEEERDYSDDDNEAGATVGQPPLLASRWGVDFWRSYAGSDIVDTSEAFASREQVVWLVSTASDIITRKEKEDLIVPCPFLIFLVPSQEKATQVSEKLLEGRELEFYKWEGDVLELLKDVREKLNKLGEHWSRDEKNKCLRETAKCFRFSGQIVRLIIL